MSIPKNIRKKQLDKRWFFFDDTYTQARASLASLMDEVIANRDVVIIQRRGCEDVAMISADELSGVLETAHLLRSPENANRLLTALARGKNLVFGLVEEPRSSGLFMSLPVTNSILFKHAIVIKGALNNKIFQSGS